jgi:hypothetical protein
MSLFQPIQELERLLGHAEQPAASIISPNSRYFNSGTSTLEQPDGDVIIYLRRRFVPQPESFAVMEEHTVGQGERLDLLAARFFGDPEKFWLLCDANGAVAPQELEAVGRRLRITYPEGIPAPRTDE